MIPRYCVILPTYNNSGTLADVVERTLKVCPDVIVVNDGSTEILISNVKLNGDYEAEW